MRVRLQRASLDGFERAADLACGVPELTAEATQAVCRAPARPERRPLEQLP
jgi:hypothetical protein